MKPQVLTTPDEWYMCMDAGIAAVQKPYEVRRFRRSGMPILTIYHVPSFVDATGWTIYFSPREKQHHLQTLIWRQNKDGHRMEDRMRGIVQTASAKPTLDETFVPLESDWVEDQLKYLSEISIPLSTAMSIGIDGESFGVHIGHKFTLEWWCDGPPEWKPVTSWTQQVIEYLKAKNANHAPQSTH